MKAEKKYYVIFKRNDRGFWLWIDRPDHTDTIHVITHKSILAAADRFGHHNNIMGMLTVWTVEPSIILAPTPEVLETWIARPYNISMFGYGAPTLGGVLLKSEIADAVWEEGEKVNRPV